MRQLFEADFSLSQNCWNNSLIERTSTFFQDFPRGNVALMHMRGRLTFVLVEQYTKSIYVRRKLA